MPDLNHENEWVTQILIDWIHNLAIKYNIDGVRVDTIMEVPKWFLDKLRESAGVFQIVEAFHGNVNVAADCQNHLDSIFNYPLFYVIKRAFCENFRELEVY